MHELHPGSSVGAPRAEPASLLARGRGAVSDDARRMYQNIVLLFAAVSEIGWITSQCSTNLPFSRRKISARLRREDNPKVRASGCEG